MRDDTNGSLRRAFEEIAENLREAARQKTKDRQVQKLNKDLQLVSEILKLVHDVEKTDGLPVSVLENFALLASVAADATPANNGIRGVMLEDSTFSVVRCWEDISLASRFRLPKALASRWPTLIAKEKADRERVQGYLAHPRECVTSRDDGTWYISFRPPYDIGMPSGVAIRRQDVNKEVAKRLDSEAASYAVIRAEKQRKKDEEAEAAWNRLKEQDRIREEVKAHMAKMIYGASDDHLKDICPVELAKDVAKCIQDRIKIPRGVSTDEGWRYLEGAEPKIPGGIRVKMDCITSEVIDAVQDFALDLHILEIIRERVTVEAGRIWRNNQTGQYALAYDVHMGPYSVTLEPTHI